MPQHQFDGPSEEERMRKREEMLLQHHADIQRLWKRINQNPREWLGRLPAAEDAFQTTTTTSE